jgi:hypothetical protein
MPEATGPIEIRLGTVAQLFNTLDPSPFREGDLAAEAEAYIVEWASELPAKQPLALVVHLPAAELATPQAQRIPEAISGYFAARALAEGRAIRANFRDGRTVLAIGLVILAVCLLLAWRAETGLREGTFSRVVQESLVILGWVAIWRPAEIFLYDWLPHARARRLFRRLAAAPVTLRAG